MESSDKFQAGQRRKLQAQRQQQGIKAPRKNRRGRQDEGEEGEKEEDAAAADKHGMVEVRQTTVAAFLRGREGGREELTSDVVVYVWGQVKWAKWRSWDELKARADELEAEIEAAAKVGASGRPIHSLYQRMRL